jgi:hypothetical protein
MLVRRVPSAWGRPASTIDWYVLEKYSAKLQAVAAAATCMEVAIEGRVQGVSRGAFEASI